MLLYDALEGSAQVCQDCQVPRFEPSRRRRSWQSFGRWDRSLRKKNLSRYHSLLLHVPQSQASVERRGNQFVAFVFPRVECHREDLNRRVFSASITPCLRPKRKSFDRVGRLTYSDRSVDASQREPVSLLIERETTLSSSAVSQLASVARAAAGVGDRRYRFSSRCERRVNTTWAMRRSRSLSPASSSSACLLRMPFRPPCST